MCGAGFDIFLEIVATEPRDRVFKSNDWPLLGAVSRLVVVHDNGWGLAKIIIVTSLVLMETLLAPLYIQELLWGQRVLCHRSPGGDLGRLHFEERQHLQIGAFFQYSLRKTGLEPPDRSKLQFNTRLSLILPHFTLGYVCASLTFMLSLQPRLVTTDKQAVCVLIISHPAGSAKHCV